MAYLDEESAKHFDAFKTYLEQFDETDGNDLFEGARA
jgi:hypothetical protein